MAYKINAEKCTGCGECQQVCEVHEAIYESRLPDPEECTSCEMCEGFDCDIFREGDPVYVIDPRFCTECIGLYDFPRCAEVCPVENCCYPDPDYRETREQLLTKENRR